MSYYVIKLYGLVCDVCERSEEFVPDRDEPRKLAAARADFAERGWRLIDGRDVCDKRDAAHEAVRGGDS